MSVKRIKRVDWAAVVGRIAHPLSVEILEVLDHLGGPVSSSELRYIFDDAEDHYLERVAYYVRALDKAGVLEQKKWRQVRGARESFYDLSPACVLIEETN